MIHLSHLLRSCAGLIVMASVLSAMNVGATQASPQAPQPAVLYLSAAPSNPVTGWSDLPPITSQRQLVEGLSGPLPTHKKAAPVNNRRRRPLSAKALKRRRVLKRAARRSRSRRFSPFRSLIATAVANPLPWTHLDLAHKKIPGRSFRYIKRKKRLVGRAAYLHQKKVAAKLAAKNANLTDKERMALNAKIAHKLALQRAQKKLKKRGKADASPVFASPSPSSIHILAPHIDFQKYIAKRESQKQQLLPSLAPVSPSTSSVPHDVATPTLSQLQAAGMEPSGGPMGYSASIRLDTSAIPPGVSGSSALFSAQDAVQQLYDMVAQDAAARGLDIKKELDAQSSPVFHRPSLGKSDPTHHNPSAQKPTAPSKTKPHKPTNHRLRTSNKHRKPNRLSKVFSTHADRYLALKREVQRIKSSRLARRRADLVAKRKQNRRRRRRSHTPLWKQLLLQQR